MRIIPAVVLLAAFAGTSFAQSVVSAKAGLVHYSEGDVLVAGKAVERKASLFTTIKAGETLATAEGRAEVLLGPGSFLRVGEHSQIKLVNAELTDVRIQLLAGSLVLELAEREKDNLTTILYQGSSFVPEKDGLYSIDTVPGLRVRVWQGEATFRKSDDSPEEKIKGGRELAMNQAASVSVSKFDKDDTDALYRWAKRRSGYVAVANISAAKSVDENSTYDVSAFRGASSPYGWTWNPYFNMFTYIPGRSHWSSPFGWTYYSPGAVMRLYQPAYYYGGFGSGGVAGAGSWSPRYDSNVGYSVTPMRTPSVSMNSGGGGISAGAPVAAPSGGGSAPAAAPGGGGRAPGGGGGGRGGN